MKKFLAPVILVFLLSSYAYCAPVIVIPGEQGQYTATIAKGGIGQDVAAFTVGAVDIFLAAPVPEGWLVCDGSTISSADYPALVVYLAGTGAPSATLPDYRGEFLRGWDHGRGLDAGRALNNVQAGQMLSHTHAGSVTSAGYHSHTGSTSPAGAHTHSIPTITPPNFSGGYLGRGGGFARKESAAYTNAAGAHSHSGTLSSAGGHTHTGSLNNSGGAEFRPRNLAVIFAIRAE